MNKTKFFSSLLVVILLASTSVFTSCKDYDDDIKKLQEQIDNRALKSELESLKTSLEAQIASVQNSLNTTKTELTAAINKKADQTTVDALASRVSTLEGTVAGLQTQIDAINTALAKYATLDYVNGTFATKTALETEIAAVKAIIDGKVEELTKAILAEAQARGEAITAEEAARKAADQAIEKSIKAQEEALAAYKKEMAKTIEELKTDVGFSGTVNKLQEDIDAVDKALKAAKEEFASFKEQYIADKAAAEKLMTKLSEKVNENLASINILNAFVKKRVTSMVLMPNFYWEGIEAIEVPFANPMVFEPKKENYTFTYYLSEPAAGDTGVEVTVMSTMAIKTVGNKFVYTEKAVLENGPWDEAASGLAGPTSLTYKTGEKLMEKQGIKKDKLKQVELSEGAKAKYHINPNTADLSTATISFFENNAEVYTRTDQNNTIKATPVSSVVDGKNTIFNNGILEVLFKVDNLANVNMFKAWAETGDYSINPDWDGAKYGGDSDAAYGDGKTLPFIAAQLETNDTTVTSDYAVVVPAGYEIIALADNKPEAKINGRDTEFSSTDSRKIRANHLYESVGYNGEWDKQNYGAIPMPATHTVKYDGVIKIDFIETHYDYYTFTKYGTSKKDQIMTKELMDELGLEYHYTLVDYIIGKNVTGESVHMEQVDENGNSTEDPTKEYFAPRSVDKDGNTIKGKVAGREVIDREPLIRVDLVKKDSKEIVRYGYVKIRIVEDKAQDMQVTIPLTDLYMNCGGEARVTWSQMENMILAKLWEDKGMRKQDFEKFYYLDVVGDWKNMPYVDPAAAGVKDDPGTLYEEAEKGKWMAKRYYNAGTTEKPNYKPAQDTNDDDKLSKLKDYTATNNWFGRVWYTPHDNATTGHNWDEATNVLIWNLMGEKDLEDAKYAGAGNMTEPAYYKLMEVGKATRKSEGKNEEAISTVVRFINKLNGTSIYVTLVFDKKQLHFAYGDINRRVLDHWYSMTDGYRDGVEDTIEVYANVPTPAEYGKKTLTTNSFKKDLKEYWLKQEIVPEIHEAAKFNKFWNKEFLGKTEFKFTWPVENENADFSAYTNDKLNGKPKVWDAPGASGRIWYVTLNAAKSEIQAIGYKDLDGEIYNYTATTVVKMDVNGNIEWMGRDRAATGSLVPDGTVRSPELINQPANDILNYIGMYKANGEKQKEGPDGYLTKQKNKTFAAFVEIEVIADNCYNPLIGDTRFNVRFLRPINVWPAETKWTDALNDTQIYDIWRLIYIRDWRGYAVVMDGAGTGLTGLIMEAQTFADDNKKHYGKYDDGNMDVPYSFYGIKNLYVKRSDIRSDAYLEPSKRIKKLDPKEIMALYSIDDIPALTNNVTGQEYLKLVDPTVTRAAAGTMKKGHPETDSALDLIAYTNNGGVVKPFYVYVPISVEYSWGALIPWTQRVWAVIQIDPTIGNE